MSTSLCLGCELYLSILRLSHRLIPDRARGRVTTTGTTTTTEVSA